MSKGQIPTVQSVYIYICIYTCIHIDKLFLKPKNSFHFLHVDDLFLAMAIATVVILPLGLLFIISGLTVNVFQVLLHTWYMIYINTQRQVFRCVLFFLVSIKVCSFCSFSSLLFWDFFAFVCFWLFLPTLTCYFLYFLGIWYSPF